MKSIAHFIKSYSFIFLWITGGFIHPYIGALLAFVTTVLLIKKERYVELLIGFWVLLIFSDSTIRGLSFAHLVKPAIMLIIGLFTLLISSKKHLKNPIIGPFIPFFIYVTIKMFFQPDFIISFQKILSFFFIYFSPPVLFLLIKRQNRVDELLKSVVVVGNFILISCIVLGVILPDIGSQYGGRLNGIFRNPNGIGLFVLLYGVLAYLIFEHISFPKTVKRITLISILIILLFSGSRSSLGSLIIFISGTFIARYSAWFFAIFTAVFYFIYPIVYDFIILSIYRLGYSKMFRLDTLGMASGRIFIWEAAKKEIMENLFFFGGGFDSANSQLWLKKYYMEIPELIHHQGNIHQSFLTMWFNNGIIGLALFAFGWMKNIIRALKKSPLTLPVVAAMIFSASYESWLVASLNPYMIQLILIFAIIFFYDHPEIQESNGENHIKL